MESIDFNNVVQNIPNFVGMVIAISVLWRVIDGQAKQIERLESALIRRENCEEK